MVATTCSWWAALCLVYHKLCRPLQLVSRLQRRQAYGNSLLNPKLPEIYAKWLEPNSVWHVFISLSYNLSTFRIMQNRNLQLFSLQQTFKTWSKVYIQNWVKYFQFKPQFTLKGLGHFESLTSISVFLFKRLLTTYRTIMVEKKTTYLVYKQINKKVTLAKQQTG